MAHIELSRTQIENLIDEWVIGKNNERNRKIMKRRLIDGIPFEKLGEEFNLSTQQVKTIVHKHLDVLSRHI